MKRLCLTVLFLNFASILPLPAVTLFLKDNSSLECESALLEGEFVRAKIKSGELKIPVAKLTEKTFNELVARDNPAVPVLTGEKPALVALDKKEEPKVPESVDFPVVAEERKAEATDISAGRNLKRIEFGRFKSTFPEKDEAVKVLEGEIPLNGRPKSGMDGDRVIVKYRMAMKADGKTPGERASQLLFYAPFFNDAGLAKGREIKDYTDLLGFTVFSFRIKSVLKDITDPEKAYWMPEAGWYDLVFEAEEKIRSKHGLAVEKMFMWGNSSGSRMAERLALAYPDKFAAVGLMGGSGFIPVDKKTGIPWLLVNTLGGSEQQENRQLTENLTKTGDTVIYAQTPPWRDFRGTETFYHTPGALAVSITQSFFWSIYQQRAADGTAAESKTWPLLARAEPPFDIYPAEAESLMPEWKTGKDWFRLPGPGMAPFWVKQPPPMETAKILSTSGRPLSLSVARPPSNGAPPRGLVLVTTEFDFLRFPDIVNDLSHWAEEGFVAMAFRANKAVLLKDDNKVPWKELAAWIATQEDLKNLSVYLSMTEKSNLPLQGLKEAGWNGRLRAALLNNIDAGTPLSDNKAEVEKFALGIPLVVAAYLEQEEKDKKKDLEARADLEKKWKSRFLDFADSPLFYLLPNTGKNMEVRRTHAIRKAVEIFNDNP